MPDWAEEVVEPVRVRARQLNAPLLRSLGVTMEQLEAVVDRLSELPPETSREVGRLAAVTALRAATRY
jgi:hypothetical protein